MDKEKKQSVAPAPVAPASQVPPVGNPGAPDLSEFNLPPEPEVQTPPIQPNIPELSTLKQEPPDVKLPITDEDRDKYFNCIMNNQPFHEVLTAFNGKLKIGYRTRTVRESEEVLKYLNKLVATKEIDFFPDFQNKHIMGHIAFAVTSLNDRNIDAGTIDERLKRITALDNQIFIILIEMLKRFDEKMQRLRDEALKPNF